MNKKRLVWLWRIFFNYDISIESGKNVHDNIDRNLWEVYLIVLDKKYGMQVTILVMNILFQREILNYIIQNQNKIRCFFNLIHGSLGENGQLASLLELEIPFQVVMVIMQH